jgi:hypothetical protein
MASELDTAVAPRSSESSASVLITLSTPGAPTPICRVGGSRGILEGLTVRDLIARAISPNSLLSVGIPMNQLEAESPTALAIGELLSARSCEVFITGNGEGAEQPVPLETPAQEVAQEQVGASGSAFLNVNLDVRATADAVAPDGDERRQLVAPEGPEADADVPQAEEHAPIVRHDPAPVAASLESDASAAPGELDTTDSQQQAARGLHSSDESIMAIVADVSPVRETAPVVRDRHEYARKADWLRAQFLPEVEALDFSGLFVGNLGLGIREERSRRNVVLADPARVTEVLLRGNGYRRSGDHAKALICYQELVDMDPGNADFRFLLGKTLLELGQEEEACEALARGKDLGHDGARKELEKIRQVSPRARRPLGFLRFWQR